MFWAVADGVNILADDRNSDAITIVIIVGAVFITNKSPHPYIASLGWPNIYVIFRFSTLRIRIKGFKMLPN